MNRNRPYDGQPHTDQGGRGKQLIEGLTIRDIVDCYVMGVYDSSGHLSKSKYYDKLNKTNDWNYQDLYKLDFNRLDPRAISQNMICRIEKMMGIFPNIIKVEEKR